MNAICLVIDRLSGGYLGCYGNAWVGTPGFDRLAAESFLLDGAYVDSPSLDWLYRSYWLGEHALNAPSSLGKEGLDEGRSLPRLLSNAGVATVLVTDAAEMARHPLTAGFGQCVEVPTDWRQRPAVELEETQTARLFSAALEALKGARPPFLLWLHSQGMAGPWDAPRTLRERYVTEDDPAPPNFVRPPALRLPADPDPDELLGIRQAYAAQVAVLDCCVETLADALRESKRAGDTLLIVLSARGHALGVHGVVGSPPGESEPLYGELTSIPWLLRFPGGMGAADRSGALVQPAELCITLQDWFGQTSGFQRQAPDGGPARGRSLLALARGEVEHIRDRAAIASPSGQRALRTPAWYARFAGPKTTDAEATAQETTASETIELYVKPDDRWEVNDVARRCPEVAEAMRRALNDFEQACTAGGSIQGATPSEPTLSELDEALVRGLR